MNNPSEGAGQFIHLPTELVLQSVDEAMDLLHSDKRVDTIRTTMDRIVESFTSWDRGDRKSFMINLLRRQAEHAPGFGEFLSKRQSGHMFPLGVNFDSHFLEALPEPLRQETFWDVARELAKDIDFTQEGDLTPNMLSDFVFNSKKAFNENAWKEIEMQLLDNFAHDTELSSDGRYQAVSGYFHKKGLFSGNDLDKIKKDTATKEAKEHFLNLQRKIAGVITDTSIKDNFRASMLKYVSYEVCGEETRKEIEDVVLAQGQGLDISEEVLSWLTFRAGWREDGGREAFEVVQKMVKERDDLPVLQIKAMTELMRYDREVGLKQEKSDHKWADIPAFVSLVREIGRASPDALEVGGDFFFMALGSSEEGVGYLKEFLISENVIERLSALHGALYWRPEMVSDTLVLRALGDISSKLESGESKPYLFKVIAGVYYKKWPFVQKDLFILTRLQEVLNKTQKTEDSEVAQNMINEIIEGLLKKS